MTDLSAVDWQGPDTLSVLVNDATSLRTKVLALLLEPMGVDASLELASLESLVRKVVSVAGAHGCADQPPSGTTLRVVADAVAQCAEEQLVIRLGAARGRTLTRSEARAVRELMGLEGLRTHIEALEGVTADALRTDLAAVAMAERVLPRILEPCRLALKDWPREIRRSILGTDFERAAANLSGHRRGRRQASGARQLVLTHSLPEAGELQDRDLVLRIQKVRAFAQARKAYEDVLSAQPAWWRWLGPDTRFRFRTEKCLAQVWAIETRDTGVVSMSTLELLGDDTIRGVIKSALAKQPAVSLTRATPPESSSAGRLLVGLLTEASGTELGELRALETWYAKHIEVFDKAASAMDTRRTSPELSEALRLLTDELPHPFGALDTTRSDYREVQSALRSEVSVRVQRTIYSVHAIENEYLVGAIGRIGTLERELRDAVQAMPAARGKLLVAIAGRTKSGKTTLRKALTRDADRAGIGRGAHRTTRATTAFEFDSVTYLDTPGVAAKDGDFDTQRAREAYEAADAVIWNYADTLRDEEAAELNRLLRLGKPLLAVVNVKERVDTPRRLELFAQRPDRVFKSAPGHFARIRQVAHAAGAKPPIILAVHSGAAHEALSLMQDELGEAAFRASRLLELEQSLAKLLTERAVPLRSVRLAEHVRSPLAAYQDRAAAELPQIDLALQELEVAPPSERAKVLAAIQTASQMALERLEAKHQVATHRLLALIPKLGGTDHERRWNGFIDHLALDSLVDDLQTEFEQDLRKRQQVLRTRASMAERQHEQRLRVPRRPDARVGRRIAAAAQGAATALLGTLTTRGITTKLAAGVPGGPVAPWLITIGYVADGAAGAARSVARDVERTRHELQVWTAEASTGAVDHVDNMFASVAAHIRRLVDETIDQVNAQFDAQVTDIGRTRDRLTHLCQMQAVAQSALDAIDLILARRLVSLAGGDASAIRSARRVPGVALRIRADESAVESVQASLQDKFVDVLRERIDIEPASGNIVTLTNGPKSQRRGHQ